MAGGATFFGDLLAMVGFGVRRPRGPSTPLLHHWQMELTGESGLHSWPPAVMQDGLEDNGKGRASSLKHLYRTHGLTPS